MKNVVLSFLLLASMSAGADTLQFIGTNHHFYLGEASYQYHMMMDDHPENMMCITDYRTIGIDETWAVNVNPITTHLEQEAAWLFLRAGNGSDSDYNGAVWYLFDPLAKLTPGAASLVALAQAQTFTADEFLDVKMLVPVINEGPNAPQIFLEQTPEPATLALFGSGMCCYALYLRRKVA